MCFDSNRQLASLLVRACVWVVGTQYFSSLSAFANNLFQFRLEMYKYRFQDRAVQFCRTISLLLTLVVGDRQRKASNSTRSDSTLMTVDNNQPTRMHVGFHKLAAICSTQFDVFTLSNQPTASDNESLIMSRHNFHQWTFYHQFWRTFFSFLFHSLKGSKQHSLTLSLALSHWK